MAEKATHGQVIASAGQTAAGRVSLGTIVLPAGGPWKIFGAWCQVVRAAATAGEANVGSLDITAQSGDVTPNVLPNSFPVQESGSFLGAVADQSVCPLKVWDIDWDAQGKAVIELGYTQDTGVTVAPQIVAGILFGDQIPTIVRPQHVGRARVAQTAVANTQIGTITLPEGAKTIVGISGTIVQDNVITAGEELIGFWSMTSDDFDVTPAQFPFTNAFGAGLGGTINSATGLQMQMIPVNIPVIGGSRMNTFVKLNTAVTNAAEVATHLFFV